MAVLVAIGLLQGEQSHEAAVKLTEKLNPVPDTYEFKRKGGQNTVTFRIEERDDSGQIANYLEFIATGAVADKVHSQLQWKSVKVKASLKVKRSKDAAPVHKYEVLDIVEA